MPAAGQQPDRPTPETEREAYDAAGRAYHPPAAIDEKADESADKKTEKESKAREEARNVRDVAAQESMADAAWRLACLTIIQVVIAGATLVFLWLTVRWAKEAAQHTEAGAAAAIKSAEAAEKALEVTRNVAQQQLRPYVSIKAEEICGFAPEMAPEVVLRVHNHGQTPAHNLRYMASCSVDTQRLSPDNHNVVEHETGRATQITVFPDDGRTAWARLRRPLTLEEFNGLKDGRLFFHIFVTARYGSNGEFVSKFGAIVRQESIDSADGSGDPLKIKIFYTRHHNDHT